MYKLGDTQKLKLKNYTGNSTDCLALSILLKKRILRLLELKNHTKNSTNYLALSILSKDRTLQLLELKNYIKNSTNRTEGLQFY